MVTLHVNGKAQQVDVPPETPLLWVLRDVLGMTGTKFGCGMAVQAAWVDLGVPHCGYCQAGQIMSATALLQQNPKPTDADIDSAMSGNICRCGTYTRIRAAIHRVAQKGATK